MNRFLSRCPMCHDPAFHEQQLSPQVTQLSCQKCGAVFKLSEGVGVCYVIALNIGADPRGIGLSLEKAEKEVSLKFWHGIDAYDPPVPRTCKECGSRVLGVPTSFRLGKPLSPWAVMILPLMAAFIADQAQNQDALIVDVYVCPSCRHVEMYLPNSQVT